MLQPLARRRLLAAGALAVLAPVLAVAACRDEPTTAAASRDAARTPGPRAVGAVAPPAASVSVTVQVPAGMRTSPFDVTRTLTVPPGFDARVYARVPGARFMAFAPNGDLLVSNAAPADVTASPPRAALDQYAATGGTGRVYARGVRNAEGLAIQPGTGTLWVVVNNRDNIAYPFHRDYTGDGSDDYGKVIPAYVDNHPPDELIRVADGADYGWPYCNPNPDATLDDMPYDRDVQTNADGARLDGAASYRIESGAPPYTIAGENGTDDLPWTPTRGRHTLTATPYDGSGATGTAGTPLTIGFTVAEKQKGRP